MPGKTAAVPALNLPFIMPVFYQATTMPTRFPLESTESWSAIVPSVDGVSRWRTLRDYFCFPFASPSVALSHAFGPHPGGWLQPVAQLARIGPGQIASLSRGAGRVGSRAHPISRRHRHTDHGCFRRRRRAAWHSQNDLDARTGSALLETRANGR